MPHSFSEEEYHNMAKCYQDAGQTSTRACQLYLERYGRAVNLRTIRGAVQRLKETGKGRPHEASGRPRYVSKLEKQVLEYFEEHPTSTMAEAAQRLHMTEDFVQDVLRGDGVNAESEVGNKAQLYLAKIRKRNRKLECMKMARAMRALNRLNQKGGEEDKNEEGSAQTSTTEPQPGTSGDTPADEQFTIVIEDPLTQTTLEGSYQDLFDGKDPHLDPGKDPAVPAETRDSNTCGDDNESDHEPPPAKKPRQPTLSINYYKTELAKYKQEVLDQLKEIQDQQKIIKARDYHIFNLNKSMQLLRDKKGIIKKDKNKLTDELRAARAELKTATKTIKKLKMKKKNENLMTNTENTTENLTANTENITENLTSSTVIADELSKTEKNTANLTINTDKATENLPSVSNDNKVNEVPTIKTNKELTASIDTQMTNLTAAIDEQNQATQIINSINESLKELATQIDKTQMIQSQEVAIQLISSMNTNLMKLEKQIRNRETELATQSERHELMMAKKSILMDTVKEKVEESSDVNTADVQFQVFSHNQSHEAH